MTLIEKMKLGFDPLAPSADPTLRAIFSDPISTSIYLGIRQGHLWEENDGKRLLKMVEIWKEKGRPQSTDNLKESLDRAFGEHAPSNYNFLNELLPYAMGDKKIDYEVVRQQ